MKKALIYGSTGLIGEQLLPLLLESKNYEKVIALTRKPLGISHEKLVEVLYDFDQADNTKLKADHIFCCMGTTIRNAGSTKRFYQIDHDYVVETARLAKEQDASLFSLVSAIGSNADSKIFYNRVKGEIEESIRQIGFKGLHIFRPSLLLGNRKEFRFGELIARIVMKYISFLVPAKHRGIQATQVAGIMEEYASLYPDSEKIVENAEMIKFQSKAI